MITSEFKFLAICLLVIVVIPKNSFLERISARKCKEYEKATQRETFVMGIPGFPKRRILTDRCQHKSVALIIGGEEAKTYEFPHQALLGYDTSKGINYLCGGSLISSNFILTAAHCNHHAHYGNVRYVKLGMNSRLQNDDKVFTYGVKEIIGHSSYRPGTYNHDISLLKLNDTVIFTEYLYPACLPTYQPENSKAIVTGFGRTARTHDSAEVLMKAIVDKFSKAECQNIFRQIRIDENSMLCYANRTFQGDSCQGDSGGPLQVANEEVANCTYKVIGVVSFGARDCGTLGIPSVYMNVYNYLEWIERTVWPNET